MFNLIDYYHELEAFKLADLARQPVFLRIAMTLIRSKP